MQVAGYLIDIETITKTIKKNNYHRVAVQLPEGLKSAAPELAIYFEKNTAATIFFVTDPCFGACDINTPNLQADTIDLLIQIGHLPIPSLQKKTSKTVIINALSTLDVTDVVEDAIPKLAGPRIGVVTTAQHIHTLDVVQQQLRNHGFTPVLGRGDMRIAAPGIILGCNFTAALSTIPQVDTFLFIGSGLFHPVGLLLSTNKPVIAADPYTNTVRQQEIHELKEKILRQRFAAITTAKEATWFGILVGEKMGQQRFHLATTLKKMIQNAGRHTLLLSVNHCSPDSLAGFTDIDCYVSTLCPRIAIDDYLLYKKPIITPPELEIVLEHRAWEDYTFDQILDTHHEPKT